MQFTPAQGVTVTGNEMTKAGWRSNRERTNWTREMEVKHEYKKFRAYVPGEYTLLAAQGRICRGDVLSPEVCRVVEVPMPKAEIEWRKLHEWFVSFGFFPLYVNAEIPHSSLSHSSGDVGVTANLVLHGTPPFQVFHKTAHNGRETTNSTIINGSRGEITLQPERSGSYVYQFVSLSDAHYNQVPLNSAPIKQTVHPLANAGFSSKGRETTVQSCSGNVVDVPVTLVGTAPWNLEYQVVGPAGSAEKKMVKGIKHNQHTLNIKIPDDVDREGGTLLVDLSE